MRRIAFVGVFVAVFALGGTTALANPNNNGRIGVAPPLEGGTDYGHCAGLYQANGQTSDRPGNAHVFENDLEMCHHENGG